MAGVTLPPGEHEVVIRLHCGWMHRIKIFGGSHNHDKNYGTGNMNEIKGQFHIKGPVHLTVEIYHMVNNEGAWVMDSMEVRHGRGAMPTIEVTGWDGGPDPVNASVEFTQQG